MSDSMASIPAPISDPPPPTALASELFSALDLQDMQNSLCQVSPLSDREPPARTNSGPAQLGTSRCRDSYALARSTASNSHKPESDDPILCIAQNRSTDPPCGSVSISMFIAVDR
ncbi:uncharacterized protein TRUGW13939_01109 [Talaromyces rugulosus]|uniref:Uncharacterized protein n=1 Tax=Talaromyces rugulosus TaxID=121627 RepID=A0A7H8QJA2_TALRU|nr:uncharacterized protein TRUGW13939_01109 [Talaromyces rugulosus]QKX54027.1 hypothetical protein TRUGW13939_01109 [Talaromyces rugulosus]